MRNRVIEIWNNRESDDDVIVVTYYQPKWKWFKFSYRNWLSWAFTIKDRIICNYIDFISGNHYDEDLSKNPIPENGFWRQYTNEEFIDRLADILKERNEEREARDELKLYVEDNLLILPHTDMTSENIEKARSFLDKLIRDASKGEKMNIHISKSLNFEDYLLEMKGYLSDEDVENCVEEAFAEIMEEERLKASKNKKN